MIERLTVDGWNVVKDDFEIDVGVFFEVDSDMVYDPRYDFLSKGGSKDFHEGLSHWYYASSWGNFTRVTKAIVGIS